MKKFVNIIVTIVCYACPMVFIAPFYLFVAPFVDVWQWSEKVTMQRFARVIPNAIRFEWRATWNTLRRNTRELCNGFVFDTSK